MIVPCLPEQAPGNWKGPRIPSVGVLTRCAILELDMPTRASRPRRPRDPNLLALSVVEDLIGERMDGSSLPPRRPEREKNPAAVALSLLGASKGGRARAQNLSARRRKMIAKKAAEARWKAAR
jgi:hypothetical protein